MQGYGDLRSRIIGLGILVTLVVTGCGDDGDGAQDGEARSRTDEAAEPTVVTGAGDIDATIDEYRGLLGRDNGGAPDENASGRREIDWDAVPDEFAAPNALPSDFFNAPDEPRARGAVL